MLRQSCIPLVALVLFALVLPRAVPALLCHPFESVARDVAM